MPISCNTVLKNPTASRQIYSFLQVPYGRTLEAGQTHTEPGDIRTRLSAPEHHREFQAFQKALEDEVIEVVSFPDVVLKDATTGDLKILRLDDGDLTMVDP